MALAIQRLFRQPTYRMASDNLYMYRRVLGSTLLRQLQFGVDMLISIPKNTQT